MQRLVKWTEGHTHRDGGGNPGPNYLGGVKDWKWSDPGDLEAGGVHALDLTVDSLKAHPELRQALSYQGRLGRIISHSMEVASSARIWTFVVEF